MAERAISLPVSLSPYGTIQTTQLQSKIWNDRVLSVLGTLIGERVMVPEFGTNIANTLFNSTESVEDSVKIEIRNAFISLLPTLTLTETTITSEPIDGTVLVEVTYALPNQEVQSTVVAIAAVGSKNPPAQENL